MPPQRVGLLRRFSLKTGVDFAHFGLETGMVYEGITVVHQCVRCFNSKWKKCNMRIRKYISRNRYRFSLSNDDTISVLCKRVMLRFVTTSMTENGCGKWHFLVWNRVRIRRTGRHTPTKNSQKYPPPPEESYRIGVHTKRILFRVGTKSCPVQCEYSLKRRDGTQNWASPLPSFFFQILQT